MKNRLQIGNAIMDEIQHSISELTDASCKQTRAMCELLGRGRVNRTFSDCQ